MVACSLLWLAVQVCTLAAEPQVFHVSTTVLLNPPLSLIQGFTAALTQTSVFPSVHLELLEDPDFYQVTTSVLVTNILLVQGSSQTIEFAGTVTVSETAHLTISKCTLRVVGNGTLSSLFTVMGVCVLEGVVVESLGSPLALLSGALTLSDVEVRRSAAEMVLIASVGTSIELKGVLATGLTEPFVAVKRASSSFVHFQLSAWNCSFTNSSSSSSQPLFDLQRLSGQMSFLSCLFESNSSPILAFNVASLAGALTNCSFQGNSKSLLSGYLSNSTLLISDCLISENAEVSINLYQFDGQFLLTNSLITRQRTKGPISIANRISTAQCLATLRNSTISLFDLAVSGTSAGLFSLYSCVGVLSHVHIFNVTIAASAVSNMRGLLLAQLGTLAISNTSMEFTGSTGFLIVVFSGSLVLKDFEIIHPSSDSGFFVACFEGSARIENGRMTLGSPLGTQSARLMKIPTYLATLQALASIRNITFESSSDVTASMMGFQYSSLTIDTIHVKGITTASILAVLVGSCSARNIDIEDTVFYRQPISSTQSTVSITGFSMANSRPAYSNHGIFYLMNRSNVTLREVKVRNVTAAALVRAPLSTIKFEDLEIQNCRLAMLVPYSSNADIAFHRLLLRNSEGQLLFDTNSTISFTDSVITNLYSRGVVMGGYSTRLTFTNVSIVELRTTAFLGKFSQSSRLTIGNSSFEGLVAEGQHGWEIEDGNLTISNSSFARYEAALFQVQSSNVSFTQTVFREGYNPTQSLASRASFGGVLGCLNCARVHIDNVHISNVTAKVGGALAFDTTLDQISIITINNSLFAGCSADKAGAIYTHSATFLIDNSHFIGNSAKTTGGGIHTSVKPMHSGTIQHSQFIGNRANEGGAVKWTNAPVSFIEAVFENNTAVYGADVASYGVALSPRLTQFLGNEVPGKPLTLVFELLDHYQHRVNLSPFQALYLTASPEISYRGNEVAVLDQGFFNFTGVTVYTQPGVQHTVQVATNYTQEDYSLVLTKELQIAFRNCTSGEVYHSDQCEVCFAGNVSYSPEDSSCLYCPEHAFCPGGHQMILNAGYWRQALNSTKLYRCPLPDKCLGGENSTCASGFTGKVCNQCLPGTYRIRGIECVECGSTLVVICQICASVAVFIVFLLAILYFAVFRPHSFKLFTLKVLLTHMQSLSYLYYLRLSYTPAVTYFLHSLSYISLLLADLPLSCLSGATVYSKAIAASVSWPILSLISLVVCWTTTKSWRANTLIAVSSSLLITSFGTVQVLMTVLSCGKVDTEAKVLFLDMGETCWQGTHLKVVYCLVIPTMTLTVIGPLSCIAVLCYSHPSAFSAYFPVWTSGYIQSSWELFSLVARGLLTCVVTLTISQNALLQLCYSFSVLIVASVVNVSIWKYIYSDTNYFLMAETSIVLVGLSGGFLSYYLSSEPGNSVGDYFFSSAVIVLNVGFLLICVYLLVTAKKSKGSALYQSPVQERRAMMDKSQANFDISAVLQVPDNSLAEV